MKQKIYNIIGRDSHGSQVSLIFNYCIVTLIILNVIALALDTISGNSGGMLQFLKIFEIVSIIVFTIEFMLRLYISDLTHPASNRLSSALKFIFSPFGLIDLFAILPFYFPFIIKVDFRFLRILRLIRFFRIFKISRYNSTLKIIWDVMKEKKSHFQMTLFIASLLLLVSAFLIYYAENPYQPEKFSDIFSSMWWAVATLTTVGYGDVVPVTSIGKIISSFVAILGIGIIALPTGIISAGFIEKINEMKSARKNNVCPHCGKPI